MNRSLGILRQHGFSLTAIAKQGQKDSKSLKILTFIATLYLPASLIATIFSSGLIESKPVDAPSVATHLVVAPQFWVLLVSTVVLMGVTVIGMLFVDKVFSRA